MKTNKSRGQSVPTDDFYAIPDDLSIPKFLLVANRKPLTAEQQARVDAFMARGKKDKPVELVRPFDPYAEQRLAERKEKNEERFAVLRATKPKEKKLTVRKGLAAGGLCTAADLAKQLGMPAKLARRALRIAKFPRPAWGWAFAEGPQLDEARKVCAAFWAKQKGAK